MDPTGGRSAPVVVRGYVVAVYAPGSGPPVANPLPGWLCDVHIIEPGWRGILRWVPVMTQSGGVYDSEHWQPRAATKKLSGGTLMLEGGPTATPPTDADGDLVIVAFLGGDAHRPVVIGQLPHSATEVPAEEGYRLLRTIGGARVGVKEDGNIEVQVPEGTTLTVSTKGGEGATIECADDAVTVTRAKLTVRKSSTSVDVQPVALEALIGDLATLLAEWYPVVQVVAAIFGVVLVNTAAILAALTVGGPGLSGRPYKAGSTESD